VAVDAAGAIYMIGTTYLPGSSGNFPFLEVCYTIRTTLDSRSRAEAVRRAAELDLLEAKDAVVNDSS
jgi:hypothetical protein